MDVTVCSISGEELTLRVESQTRVAELMGLIAERSGIPVEIQALALGDRTIHERDQRPLEAFLGDGISELSFSLVVSTEKLFSRLRNKRKDIKLTALEAMRKLGPTWRSDETLSEIVSCLQAATAAKDPITVAVVEVLLAIMGKGDSNTIAKLLGMQPKTKWAKIAALETLGEVAKNGDGLAVDRVLAILTVERDQEVVVAAFGALGELVAKGDSRAMAAAIAALNNFVHEVKIFAAARVVIQKLAEEGDEGLLQMLLALIGPTTNVPTYRKSYVMGITANLLRELWGDKAMDNELVIAAVVANLEDDNAAVRDAAVDALSLLVNRGDEVAISSVRTLLRHEKAHVRMAAVRGLGQVALIDDERIVAELMDLHSGNTADSSEVVRLVASQVAYGVLCRWSKRQLRLFAKDLKVRTKNSDSVNDLAQHIVYKMGPLESKIPKEDDLVHTQRT